MMRVEMAGFKTVGAARSITANASDSDGRIYRVEFFQGSTSLGIVTNTPYTLNWTNVAAGAYALTAVATDNFGAATTSGAIYVLADVDPYSVDSDGDGISDGWEALLGLNPAANDSLQSAQRANYIYDFSDWLNQVSGIKSGTVSLDNEGNVLSVSQ